MHGSYLTSRKKTAHGMNTDDTHDYLVSVARELGINVSSEKKEYDESKEEVRTESRSYREQDPFNEFLGGASGQKDEGLVKAFPDVFFLGKGYDSDRPSLSEEQTRHLLMQFTTNAASCQPLLFYLFDQLQRFGSIRGMYAKAQNKREFAKFAEEYLSESFQEKLKEAVKDPHGKVAKQIMKKIEPFLTGGGKLTTYGALARADTGGKILAMRRRFGCAPAFLTFAINDVNHPTSIRMTMSSQSNTDFPAVVSGGHHEAMKHGFRCYLGEGGISIPASYSARLRALVENPVGAAWVYKQLVNDVLSILVGKRPASGQKSRTIKKTKCTFWDKENLGAIIGTPLAYLGVTETTGGGSLHFHVVLWGGLSPDLLEMVSDLPNLCEYVGSVLDSTYSAALPRDAHVRDLVTKDLRQNCDSSTAFRRRDAAARAMQIPPDPVTGEEFQNFVTCTVCGLNIHEHSHTCYKPPNGFHGCRMFRPAGDSDGTKAIQLFWSEEKGKAEGMEKIEAAGLVPECLKYDLSPLASPDNRILLWELDRPKMDGLPALDYGLDDEEKAKAHIISKLSEAMWGEINSQSQCSYIVECDALGREHYSSDEIDTHTFFDDHDCLFLGMLKGLVIAGVSPAYESSVKDLRKELMGWLEKHPGDDFRGKTLEQLALEKMEQQDSSLSAYAEKNQPGSEMELYLLSKAKGVNVRLYTEDASSGSFSLEEVLKAGGDAENAAAIYFVKRTGEDCYKLFLPRTDAITQELRSLSLKQLLGLYDRVAKKLVDRNGWVVEYNPLLSSLLGCNTNLSFLGSKEQSKQALFYIGPYINKNGVKVLDALPLLAHAQNHALQYPSTAGDSGTSERQVQHIMTRVLNKLNSLMEISDTQAALALLGMGPTVCSESFSFYDLKTTKNFVLDQYFGKCDSLGDMGIVLDGVDDAESLGDNDSFSSVPIDSDEDEMDDDRDEMEDVEVRSDTDVESGVRIEEMDDGCDEMDTYELSGAGAEYDSSDVGVERGVRINEMDDGCGEMDIDELSGAGAEYDSSDVGVASDVRIDEMDDGCDEMDIDELSGAGAEYDSFPEDESGTKNEDVECEKDFVDEESSDDETVAEPVQFRGSPIAVPLNYVTGEYGHGRLVKTQNPENLHSIPYPVFYRYRGEALKRLNRLEYYSLVQVNCRRKNESKEGRLKSKEFPFGCGLDEQIGGTGIGRYYQCMRSKQCTPQFFSSPPSHPGRRPSDTEKEKVWRTKADKFACDYLIMFRPESNLYKDGQSCRTCEYNWEAFEDYVQQLKMSNNAIDHSRLEQMERMVHSRGVNEGKRGVLTEWRGRHRTIWSAEDKKLASAEYAKFKRGRFGGEDGNNVDYDGIGVPSEQMTLRQTRDASKTISHSNEVLTELRKLHDVQGRGEHESGPFEPTKTTIFNEDLANSLHKLQPEDDINDSGDNASTTHWNVPGSTDAKVETYLKDEDLSSDKTPVVDVMREHYRAVREGRSQATRYNAPLLLVCGGPGNGKSKLIETLDGVASLMGAGTQVKSAYLGVAAVNIGGSSLCSLFDIPTERRESGGVDFKKSILPWSDEKKRKFRKMYDINKISCVVVDEISTVQPYVLAYLSARLMGLLPESGKDFGGLAVILCGDFDQLPPVAGDSCASATMKYEELQGSSRHGDVTRWDTSKHSVNVHNEGIRLFRKAVCFQLTQQHRSKDPVHTEIIENMRKSGKVGMKDLTNICKLLKQEDVVGDGEFRFATTLVTGNDERQKINNCKAKDWASHHGTFLTRWLRRIDYCKWKGKPRSEECIKHVMANNDSFYELFVPGARGYLSHNINTSIGLANGTEIKYHSLSFGDPGDESEYLRSLRCSSPGETITLHEPPSAINVELFADFPGDLAAQKKKNANKRRNWRHGSLVSGRVVVPISTKYASYNKWEKTFVPPHPLYSVSKVPLRDYFCIEPGFCITVHKAQGRTIRRLILSISDHPTPKLRQKWEGLYVCLSRVELNEHMRLLLKRGDWGTATFVRALEKCKHTDCFFEGYRHHTNQKGMTWDRRLARAAAGLDGKKAGVREKKKTRKTKKKSKRVVPVVVGRQRKIKSAGLSN